MFPIKCCIIVPMNAKMAKPAMALVDFRFSTHWVAFSPKGEMSTMSAVMCNHVNGNARFVLPNGMFMKFSVNGLRTKAKSKPRFNVMTGNHFRLTRNPKATAFTSPGRKSKPKNTGGFALIAVKVPIRTLIPPTYGPNIIP